MEQPAASVDKFAAGRLATHCLGWMRLSEVDELWIAPALRRLGIIKFVLPRNAKLHRKSSRQKEGCVS